MLFVVIASSCACSQTTFLSLLSRVRLCSLKQIINSRKYNLKADVYSWAMVVYEMFSLEKPFVEYEPKQHQVLVAGMGERPILLTSKEGEDDQIPMMPDASDYTNASCSSIIDPTTDTSESNSGSTNTVGELPPKIKYKSVRKLVPAHDWPTGLTYILEQAWCQDVSERWSISTVFQQLQPIVQAAATSS